jgi:ribosomal protein S27AE
LPGLRGPLARYHRNCATTGGFIAGATTEVAMAVAKLKDCPVRPECPKCGMQMIQIEKTELAADLESCRFECLRCGYAETSEPGPAH